jgi:hypothetical protein
VPRCRGVRNSWLGGCRSVRRWHGGHWARPGRPPRMELVTVGEAHKVAVSRGMEVQAPEPNLEFSWEGVGAAHGLPLGCDLGANHH